MKPKSYLPWVAVAAMIFPQLLLAAGAPAKASMSRTASQTYAAVPLSFEPTSSSDTYLARSGRYTVFIGARESSVAVTDIRSGARQTLKFAFHNSNPAAKIEALEPLAGVTNYYIGPNPRDWRLGVKNFAKLRTSDLYPGVDVVYYGDHRRLEFDFVIAPKADPAVIGLSFSGMDKLYTDASGDLIAELNGQPVRFMKPYAYQKLAAGNKPVNVSYAVVGKGEARLRVGAYDKSRELVIDPVVTYATYLGGVQRDIANAIVVDGTGNAYITGQTCSPTFPGSTATITNCSAFVTKLNPTGSAIVFSTIIVGNHTLGSNAIALDTVGGIYIAGETNSDTGLPNLVPGNAYHGGDNDAFIAELAADGSLTRTAYLGGENADLAFGVAVDDTATPPVHSVVAVGETCSNFSGPGYTFPAYSGFQEKVEFCVAFVTKLDNALNIPPNPERFIDPPAGCTSVPCTLGAATYYFSEFWGGMPGNVPFMGGWTPNQRYVAGDVVSAGVSAYSIVNGVETWAPPVAAAFRCVHSGITGPASGGPGPNVNHGQWTLTPGDLTSDGSVVWENEGPPVAIIYAATHARGVALDSLGDVFVVGDSDSDLVGCQLTAPPLACVPFSYFIGKGAWLLKLRGTDGERVYSTVLGTIKTDTANAVAVDQRGRPYIVGTSTGGIFTPVNANSFNRKNSEGQDAFVMRMATAGPPDIEYSGYLGGGLDDQGLGVVVDSNGGAYVAGSTKSPNFPTVDPLINPLSTPPYLAMNALSGPEDAFVAKITADGSALAFSTYLGGSASDHATGIAVHGTGNDMYVAGVTNSSDFPVYPNQAPLPVQTTYAGADDALVVMIPGASLASGAISPASLGFDSQLVSTTSAPKTVTFTNSGTTPITLSTISASGDFKQTNNCPTAALAASANCVISVTFTPTSTGTRTGSLTVSYSGGNANIPLAGTGTTLNSGDPVAASPTGLTFAAQVLNSPSQPQTVTLTNLGADSVAVFGISITGDFKQTTNCATLAAGATCTFSVTFMPTAAGARTGTLTFSDTGASTSQTITLAGTGATSGGGGGGTPSFTMSGPDGGIKATQGQPATFNVTVTPVNGFSQSVSLACSVPAPATCTFNPTSVQPTGTAAVQSTATVTLPSGTPPGGPGWTAQNRHGRPWQTLLPFAIVGVAMMGSRRRHWLMLLVLAVCLALALVGCGGGGSSGSSGSTSGGTTMAPGNYTVTVTATYQGGSPVTVSIPMTVQ